MIYYIINRLSIKVLQNIISNKIWYKNKFNISDLIIYIYNIYIVDNKAKVEDNTYIHKVKNLLIIKLKIYSKFEIEYKTLL